MGVFFVWAAPATARVVVVGIDGASWNVIDPLLAEGELPHLAALAARGVTAELRTVEPVNSPAVWTSIATGRDPRNHGVTDFQATRLTIRVPSVFERLSVAGWRVGLYEYLVTWPPATLPGGFVVPGWLRHDEHVSPPGLWDAAGLDPWLLSYEDEFTHDELLALSQRELSVKAGRWNRLSEVFDVEVGAVTFYTVDTLSHRFWSAAFPEQFPRKRRPVDPPAAHRSAVVDALRGADRSLGEIAGALGPDDSLLVVSDHGFEADRDAPNVWVPRIAASFERAGLEPGRDGFHVVTRFGIVILEVHDGPFEEREAVLERLLAVLDAWRSADGDRLFDVQLIDAASRPPGQERPVWRRLRQWVVKQVVERVYKMNTDRPGHAYVFARPRDGALARLWPEGSVVPGGGEAVPLRQAFFRDAFPGKHHPTAVFVGAGGSIARRADRGSLSVLDVAPLVFYLAGSPIPDDLEGELPQTLIAPERLAAQPPRRVTAAELPGLPPVLEELDPGDDPELVEMLRRLGYLQ